MADFPELDDFEAAPSASTGDFLSRERQLLGDEFGSPDDFPVIENQQQPDFLDQDDDAPPPSNTFVNNFSRDPVSVTGHDDFAKFQEQYPDVEQPQSTQPQISNGVSSQSQQQQAPLPSFSTAEPDSEAIKEWKSRQADEIASKDQASAKKHEATIDKAERAIDDFYKEYNAKKEKQIAQNKKDEAEYLANRQDNLAKGTAWDRICQLIDLQDSRSKTNTKSSKDLSRMKEIILSLKREGDTAPGAAGI